MGTHHGARGLESHDGLTGSKSAESRLSHYPIRRPIRVRLYRRGGAARHLPPVASFWIR